MHLLSVEMEPILHHSCPHNCQDLLSWLPPSIVFKIMGYLDPGESHKYDKGLSNCIPSYPVSVVWLKIDHKFMCTCVIIIEMCVSIFD